MTSPRQALVDVEQPLDGGLAIGVIKLHRRRGPAVHSQRSQTAGPNHPRDIIPPRHFGNVEESGGDEKRRRDSMGLEHWIGVDVVVAIAVVEGEHHVPAVRLAQGLLDIVQSDHVEMLGHRGELKIEVLIRRTPEVSVQHRMTAIADPVIVQDQHALPNATPPQGTTAPGEVECLREQPAFGKFKKHRGPIQSRLDQPHRDVQGDGSAKVCSNSCTLKPVAAKFDADTVAKLLGN